MTHLEKKAELAKKERYLKLLKEKIVKGEVFGNGVPDLVKELTTEIHKLKVELHQRS